MTVVQEAIRVTSATPQRYGAAADVLAMKTLSPHDKVRRYMEEQESRHVPPTDATPEVASSEGEHDAALLGQHEDGDGETNHKIVPLTGEPGPDARERVPDRQKEKKKQKKQQAPRKRKQRSESAGREADDPLLLFRRSQKALRTEARHVNMKEVLSRSLSGLFDGSGEASNPFSPAAGSQSSSAWSPLVANSITSQFLSNVRQRKKQTFERLLQKEIANSQLSTSRLTPDDGEYDDRIPELVIGDETAVMEPPSMGHDALLMDAGTTSSQADTLLMGNTTSRGFVELDEEAEQAQSEALMRKHELWRLRQKHLRERLRAEESVPQLKRGGHEASLRGQPQTTVPMNFVTQSTSSLTTARGTTADVDGPTETLVLAHCSIIQQSQSLALGLSADHIEMIRRANNFDNTSSQRLVVFETKSRKKREGLAHLQQ
ncbi:hypothetical protein BCY84_13980 [Trypanosoma cruzi cruzi]|uniref:Uncharacterized protein n=1 Tax=Trypanosoma cruzi TaxID=5693 RepID=A0A2V2W175_TRYCR|nr:hypothetical protein BCY84_13980 [Trypanosoma cruzi cruzi]PWV02388.1 hypothetical protein C4B63_2g829 [Trypanosoma cruzi]